VVPERVRRALALPVLYHRGQEFRRILGDVTAMSKDVVGTQDDIFIIGASGTGGMEAALANILTPGDAVLIIVCGQFGERFVSIATSMGATVDQVVVPWGEAPDAASVAARLRTRKYRAVVCVHNESSTGVVTDIAAIGRLVSETDALFVVDSVSDLGGIELRMDDWGIDILIGASQKALMCPPGLAVIAASRKAMAIIENTSTIPRFYFDLRRAKAAAKNNETAFTPPVSLVVTLREALTMIHEEGLKAVLSRHRRISEALQAGCVALGLPIVPPPSARSATVTVVRTPDGLEGSAIVRHMYSHHGTVIAGQRTKLQNRVIRFGTMGCIGADDILTDLKQLEETLRVLGQTVAAGAGVRAASDLLGAKN
jgi:aspartate aminotransferase-like enzyme